MTLQRGVVFTIVTCTLFLLQRELLEAKQCLESIPTLNKVSQCPTTKEAWLDAAKRKRCDTIAKIQTCVPDTGKFVYHCLVNQWQNGTVEVCAPNWILTGYCGYYDTVIGKIVNNVHKDCTLFNEPCPSRYNSSEAYKYQGCFPVKRNGNTCGIEQKCESSQEWMLVAFVIVALILLLVVSIVTYCICKSRKSADKSKVGEKSRKGIQYHREEEEEEVTVPFNNGALNGSSHGVGVSQEQEMSEGIADLENPPLFYGKEIVYHANTSKHQCGSGSSRAIHSDLLDTATSDALETDKEGSTLSTSFPRMPETKNTKRRRRRKQKNKHRADDFRVQRK